MTSVDTRGSASRRWLFLALKLTVSVALLAWLFSGIDLANLWAQARHASLMWLVIAMVFYTVNVAAGTWRWRLLLEAQHVHVPQPRLVGSFLVALFFNNFLPSNIGGDVIRISDTAGPARSKTLATMIVFMDRALGLMGLVLVAAIGATVASGATGRASSPVWPPLLWAGFVLGAIATAPAVLAPAGFGRLLRPLTVVHPEWVGGRIETLTATLSRFRDAPSALGGTFVGAVVVQGLTVLFYWAVAVALGIPITFWNLAVIVPVSFIVQMAPVSVNGFGVREATYSFYFARLGLPKESAILLSLLATALTMLFSLSGAAVYVSRRS
jgi:uncharacterized membrane protein YbhN (UPF0104 family)